jgi:hypothetical protein
MSFGPQETVHGVLRDGRRRLFGGRGPERVKPWAWDFKVKPVLEHA